MNRIGNRKRGEKRRRPGLVALAALAVFLAAAAPVYLWWTEIGRLAMGLYSSFLNHAYFSVREIKVRGGEKVAGDEIVAMAGLSHGMGIWKIEPVLIENRVEKHPWVRRAVVRREFPHRVVIEVEERVPKAIMVVGRLYYVDRDGVVFKDVGDGEMVDLPLLTGLKQEDLVAQAQSPRSKIQEALRLGDLAASASLALSEIHFLPGDGVVLYPVEFPVALHMGWGDWEGKLDRLERVLALWKGKEKRLAALNLSFSDQVVATLRTTEGSKERLRSHG